MVEGHIRGINRTERRAVIVTHDGREVAVQFGPQAHFEVADLATMGHRGGTLDDIGEGYLVQMEAYSRNEDGSCNCESLISMS